MSQESLDSCRFNTVREKIGCTAVSKLMKSDPCDPAFTEGYVLPVGYCGLAHWPRPAKNKPGALKAFKSPIPF